MKRYSIIMIVLLFISTLTVAQTRKISGTVISGDDKSSMQGVNVILKGTSIGAINAP